jgi:hypothetical protein
MRIVDRYRLEYYIIKNSKVIPPRVCLMIIVKMV